MSLHERSITRSPLGASLAALCVIVLFLMIMMPGIYRSTFTVFEPGADGNESVDQLFAAHERNMDTDVARFNGRSFFYLPRPKPKPRPIPPPRTEPVPEPTPEPTPDPAPTYPPTYTGPKLIAILGDQAWFRKSSSTLDPATRIRIGETQHGIEVLSTNAPRGIQVKYNNGGPYDVQLINMDADPFADVTDYPMPRGVLEDVVPEHEEGHGQPCPPKMEGVDIPIPEVETEPEDIPVSNTNVIEDNESPLNTLAEDESKDLPAEEEPETPPADEPVPEYELQ